MAETNKCNQFTVSISYLWRMYADVNGRTIDFFTLDALNVYNKLLAVNLDNLANLLSFVMTSYNLQIDDEILFNTIS